MIDTLGNQTTAKVGDLVHHKKSGQYAVVTDIISKPDRGREKLYFGEWYTTMEGAINSDKTKLADFLGAGFNYGDDLTLIKTKEDLENNNTICKCDIWITGCKCGVFSKEKNPKN